MPNSGTPPWARRGKEGDYGHGGKKHQELVEKRVQDGLITREEADLELDSKYQEEKWFREKGEDILSPKCPYPLRPEFQGMLVWLTGAPGSDKSTTTLLLAKHKGRFEIGFSKHKLT